jgi:hypothetical protein
MANKVKILKEIFAKIDPHNELQVEDSPLGGGRMVYGPFPSFILLVEEDQSKPIRALVHVNADAPNLLYIFNAFSSELDILFDGPFAVEGDSGKLILGAEAYTKKDDNVLMFAQQIMERRREERAEIMSGFVDTMGNLISQEDKNIILTP